MKAMIYGQSQDHVLLRRPPYYQETIGDFAREQSQEVNYLDDFIYPPDFQQQAPRFQQQESQFQPMQQYNQQGMHPMEQPYNFPPTAPHPVQQNSKIQAMLQQILDDQMQSTKNLSEKMEILVNSFSNKNESLVGRIKKLHTQIAQTEEELKRQEMEEKKAFCQVISIREAEFVPTHTPPQTAVNMATRPEQDHYSLDSTGGYKPKQLKRKLGLPCTINGVLFKDSLCDTESHINIMSKGIAKKVGIEELKPSKIPMPFGEDPSIISHGFISDLPLSIGDHVYKADFHILEMKDDPHMPLIFGSSFLHANGAFVEHLNQRVYLPKPKKDNYPVVPIKSSHSADVCAREEPISEPNNEQEELIDVISAAPLIIPKEVVISAKAKCIKVSSPSKILTPREYKEDVIDATPQPTRSSRCFSNFRISSSNKENEEPIKDKPHKRRNFFPGAIVSCYYIQELQDVNRRTFKPSGPECREAKGAPTLLVNPLDN